MIFRADAPPLRFAKQIEVPGSPDQNVVITTDYFGNKYEADPDNMKVSIHVYGIAVENGKTLISSQFDGYD